MNLKRWLPCLDWAASYDKATAGKDGLAAVIVTLMLIPQSLAYAMLAGLPPITGLYASIAPLFMYAIFGSSRTLAVGPVAVISLMTAAALTPMFVAETVEYVGAAMLLATLSGVMLLLMAVLRLGFLANFLSHPVISGFISASGLLIALSQLKHILGVQAGGDTVLQLVPSLMSQIPYIHVPTLLIGGLCLLFLQLVRTRLKGFLLSVGCSKGWADSLTKTGPVLTIIVSVLAVTLGDLANSGVQVVGSVPEGLPVLRMPTMDMQLAIQLLPAALLISLVGFVESVSVAQTLAAKRRERIDPDQELVGLGTANIAAAVSGGFPVTGGFSRSIVNFDAGARTPMAGVLTAVGIAVTAMFFTPLFHNLPHAVLAATIIVAVLSLVDFKSLQRTWRFSKQDFIAQAATMIGVLFMGVEVGIIMGVSLSLLLFLWRTSRPHSAVVGQLPGSEHFRNIERFAVIQSETVVSLRVDESLYFPNARYLEERVIELMVEYPHCQHLVLMCSGVNLIDASALDSLEAIAERLKASNVQLHLSEVKGPVMDQLHRSEFLQSFGGQVFVSQFAAMRALDAPSVERACAVPAKTA